MDDRQLLRQLQKKSRGALEAAIAQYGAYVLAVIRIPPLRFVSTC